MVMAFSGKRFRRSERKIDARMMANDEASLLSSSSSEIKVGDGVNDGSAVASLALALAESEAETKALTEAAAAAVTGVAEEACR